MKSEDEHRFEDDERRAAPTVIALMALVLLSMIWAPILGLFVLAAAVLVVLDVADRR